MQANDTTNNRQLFYLVGIIGLSCTIWLISALIDVDGHDGSTGQSEEQVNSLAVVASSSEQTFSTATDFQQPLKAIDQKNQDVNIVQDNLSLQCSTRCDLTLSMLDQVAELGDETFQKLGAYTQEIASYLENNKDKREYYTQIAMTTTDGDKRAYLTDIFKHLPEQQRVEIGESFIASDKWRVRADGVTLVADNGISNLAMASSLVDILLRDENSYVKGRVLTYLANSKPLAGDVEVLTQLDSAIYYETNTSVRIAALRAKMQLSEEPSHILPDALQALRTSDPDFQLAGLIAIEEVLRHDKQRSEKGAYIDMNSIKSEFQAIQNLTFYGEDKKGFDKLIKEANSIYLRYF